MEFSYSQSADLAHKYHCILLVKLGREKNGGIPTDTEIKKTFRKNEDMVEKIYKGEVSEEFINALQNLPEPKNGNYHNMSDARLDAILYHVGETDRDIDDIIKELEEERDKLIAKKKQLEE